LWAWDAALYLQGLLATAQPHRAIAALSKSAALLCGVNADRRGPNSHRLARNRCSWRHRDAAPSFAIAAMAQHHGFPVTIARLSVRAVAGRDV
jgi:hypothetical protein